jgi:carboxyl-terminal processing protease
MKNLLLQAVVSLCLLLSVPALSNTLEPESVHRITTLEILKKLELRHFESIQVDDALSKSFLDSYLATVDGNRQVFLEEDIQRFTQQYATKLDDALKRGDVSPGFAIFNLYRDRMTAQLEKQLAMMDSTIKGFNFEQKESILIDRSEAPWPKNREELDDIFRKRLKAAALSLRLSGKEEDKIIELLTKRYKNQLDRLQQLNSEDVYQLYINAFTKLYDPHTNYLSPATSKNFDISMSLKLEGIGAMLRMTDEYTEVVRLIHAGPAFKQGQLQPSDKIVGVGQGDEEIVDVVGWRLDEVVNLIRGPKGSVVKLEIIPAKALSDDERKIIVITRDEVKLEEQSVQKAMLEVKDEQGITHKIGILDIPTFYIDFEALRNRDPNYRSTTRDTAKLLSELVNDGAEGIVIDLRNNGGGSLREANELTGLFIEKGPSVQIRLSDKRTYTEAKNYFSPYYEGPVVVLINRMSASASEIFAGALQDYNRAIIVGTDSFGKGTVQSLTPLNHGKLKITESKFYRISGNSTQNKGVTPDILLPSIYDQDLIGESSLDHAMAWDAIKPASFKALPSLGPVIKQLKYNSEQRAANDPDFIFVNDKNRYEDSLDLDYLSLNEKERKDLREADKKARLELENSLRKAKGEPLLTSLDSDDEEAEEKEKEAEKAPDAINMDDAYLKEAAAILLDYKKVEEAPKLAK